MLKKEEDDYRTASNETQSLDQSCLLFYFCAALQQKCENAPKE